MNFLLQVRSLSRVTLFEINSPFPPGLSKSVHPTRHADPRTRPDPNLSFVSGRVGSFKFETCRVGSGRKVSGPKSVGSKRIRNGSGRVGSKTDPKRIRKRIQKGSKTGRVGSDPKRIQKVSGPKGSMFLKKDPKRIQLKSGPKRVHERTRTKHVLKS